MSRTNRALGTVLAIFAATGCAKAAQGVADAAGSQGDTATGGDTPPGPDASCGNTCDQDHDGVVDGSDQCPNTPVGEKVNKVGCSDSQLTPKLNPAFPPYGLTFAPTGNPGRAGGLTWRYSGITRGDLFHIYWIVCDDPATPCGLSLDGPIDVAAEDWVFSAADSDLPNGKLVYTNTTHILLADSSTPQLNGRLTVTIVDDANAVMPFADVATLGVTARSGTHGAEIKGTGYKVVVLTEVQDSTLTWTPSLDYYDGAATPDPGPGETSSFGGSFYDK